MTIKKKILIRAGTLVLTLLLTVLGIHGCSPHQVIRTPAGPISTTLTELTTDPARRAAVERHSVEIHPEFRLGFVELDDQGGFWDRRQIDEIEKMVLTGGDEEGTPGVLLVTFVHGWKHDAHVCDENVACFREVLKSLYNLELLAAVQNGVAPRRVAGVYVGWRGLSVTPPGLKETSFYSRKETAHRVGHGEVLELFTRLELLRDRVRSSGGVRSKLLIVGHSFGGALVYSAIAPLFQERLVRSAGQTPASIVTGFGDLVLLVNPAFEASLYSGINHVAGSRLAYAPSQPAVLLVVSSETDSATRTWFPVGRFFSTLFQRTSSRLQKDSLTATLGNFEPFRTHRMVKAPTATRGGLLPDIREIGPGQGRGGADCLCRYIQVDAMTEGDVMAVAGAPGEGTPATPQLADGSELFGGVALTPVRPLPAYDPFLVARATDEIITQHNGIYNRLFLDFLRAFILEIERRPETGEFPGR